MKLMLRRLLFLITPLVAFTLIGACANNAVSRPTESASPIVRPSTVNVKPEDMSAVWETYRILKRDYVDQTKVDPVKLSEAAIRGMTSGDQISVQPSNEAPSGVPRELLSIWDTFQKISRTKGDASPAFLKTLNEAAINAMLDSLDDPYTSYVSPENLARVSEEIHGTFEGIGAVVGVRDDKFTIIAPMRDSPAQKAGIQAGDVIFKVNGEAIADANGKAILKSNGSTLSINEVVLKIRGPRGTKVKLEVQHEGATVPVEVEVVRDKIQLTSVLLQMRPDKVAHIELSSFTDSTGIEFKEVLRSAIDQGAVGIVLDMRNNPGGLLDTTVEVTSEFLDGGLILYEIDSKGERTDWRDRSSGLARNLPTVVLVNAASASGAEVAAGALQDRGRAKLVGVQTFGKGSVNFVRNLDAGGAIYVTHALWYTPGGLQINLKGLTPDIEIKLTQQDVQAGKDVQLEKALEILKGITASGTTG